jgi:PASTA domain/zinc-ribbon domain
VIVCQHCGHENPDGASFCSHCGEYLPWDGNPPEETGADADTGAAVAVAMDPHDLQVAGGGEAQCQVQVRNTGRVVDRFTIEVLGPPAAWAEVDVPVLELMPNHEGTVDIRFRPPQSPDTPAGRTAFTVQVTSRADPGVVGRVDGAVDLEPFSAIQPELIPRTSEGRRVGEHQLVVSNAGNALLRAAIEVHDPDQKLRAAVGPRRLELPPGGALPARIVVRPRRRRWLGQPVTHPFQVAIDAGHGAPVTVDGAMLQQPLLPRWVIPVAAGLVALLVAVLAFVRPGSPDGAASAAKVAGSGAAKAATTVSSAATPGGNAGAGGGGAGAGGAGGGGGGAGGGGGGSSTTSSTSPAGRPTVPDVAGQDVAAAARGLEAAGFTTQQIRQVSNQVPGDHVIRTDPAGGTRADRGTRVKLTVSSGPTPIIHLQDRADAADWSSGAGPLAFNGSDGDDHGFVLRREGFPLEDGTSPQAVLETHPQWTPGGYVEGDFKLPAPIIAGDRFTADVGFLTSPTGNIVGEVDFTVLVIGKHGTPRVAGTVHDSGLDGQRRHLDIDLSPFAGARTLRLRVDAGPSSDQDWAVWIDPTFGGKPR